MENKIEYLDKDKLMVKTVPDIDVKNYEDFKKKWCNRHLYSISYDSMGRGGGSIDLIQNIKLDLPHYQSYIALGDLMFTPAEFGWANESQRRKFYSDAKKAGVARVAGKKNTWYKLIELKEK